MTSMSTVEVRLHRKDLIYLPSGYMPIDDYPLPANAKDEKKVKFKIPNMEDIKEEQVKQDDESAANQNSANEKAEKKEEPAKTVSKYTFSL